MKALQANHVSRQRDRVRWLGCLVLLVGLPILAYYGYCWGLWGRQSLLLQYLFQCSCPAASGEARYPKHVDIVVPACRYVSSTLSPSGRLLSVSEKTSGSMSTYILDLQTGEKILFPLPEKSGFYFLSDDLLYVSLHGGKEYMLDRITGDQYPIQRFSALHPDAYQGNDVNSGRLAEALRQAKFVFLRDYDGSIIALDPDFPTFSEDNFIIERFDIPGDNPNRTEQFLKESNVAYQTILPDYPEEVVSRDKRFVARPDGIYVVETGLKIVEGYSASRSYSAYSRKYFFARGWTYDGRGVIYSKFLNPCLIESSFVVLDDPVCIIEVLQPVIKLKVPEEYLLPGQAP